jgi:hypothetical protein
MDSWSEVLASLPRGFWSGNLAIGAGLAADAVIATLGVAASIQRRWGRWLYWTLGVTFTHWLFPLIGFSIGWVARDHGAIVRGVYLLGALLLWRHLHRNVVQHALEERPARPPRATSYSELSLVILGVSIDALLSGPAQSVVARQWTGAELSVSFAAIGVIVFALVCASASACLLALHVARARGRSIAASLGMTAFVAASWTIEVIVFSGFVTLALGRALLPSDVSHFGLVAAGTGLAAALLLWLLHARRIRCYCREIARSLVVHGA